MPGNLDLTVCAGPPKTGTLSMTMPELIDFPAMSCAKAIPCHLLLFAAVLWLWWATLAQSQLSAPPPKPSVDENAPFLHQSNLGEANGRKHSH